MRVAVGRLTASISASSLGVSGPCSSTVTSAEALEGRISVPASWRIRRAALLMTSRRCAAVSSRVLGSVSC